MSEKTPLSPEKARPAFTPEERRFQEVIPSHEISPEIRSKIVVESKEQALREAKTSEIITPPEETQQQQSSGLGRKQAYKTTLKVIERDQSAPERAFSRIVHNRTVESASETAGKSLARPKPLLWAGIGACFSLGFFYIVASYYGYQMSGFEGIGGLIIGYILGLVFDLATLKRRDH